MPPIGRERYVNTAPADPCFGRLTRAHEDTIVLCYYHFYEFKQKTRPASYNGRAGGGRMAQSNDVWRYYGYQRSYKPPYCVGITMRKCHLMGQC